MTAYTPTIREKILLYLRNIGETRYRRLEKAFPGSERVILELWQQGFIKIDALEELREDLAGLDPLKVPVSVIKRRQDTVELFSFWEDPVSGEKYGSLVIPSDAWVRIR